MLMWIVMPYFYKPQSKVSQSQLKTIFYDLEKI